MHKLSINMLDTKTSPNFLMHKLSINTFNTKTSPNFLIYKLPINTLNTKTSTKVPDQEILLKYPVSTVFRVLCLNLPKNCEFPQILYTKKLNQVKVRLFIQCVTAYLGLALFSFKVKHTLKMRTFHKVFPKFARGQNKFL